MGEELQQTAFKSTHQNHRYHDTLLSDDFHTLSLVVDYHAHEISGNSALH